MSTINDLLLKHKIAQLPPQEELTPEQLKLDQIDLINDWAIANPTRVLGDDFYQQRQYLTPETWRKVVAELNLTKDEILKNKKIPDHIKSTAFNNSIREATNEAAKPIAAAIIGGASVPVLAGLGSTAGILGNTLRFGLTNPVGQQLTKKFIGDMLVGTAGSMAVNEGSKALTDKTIGDHFETVTDYVPYLNRVPGQYRNMAGEFLNIGGWMGGALFSNAANRLAGLTNRGLSYAGNQVGNLLSKNNYYRNYRLARQFNKNIKLGILLGNYYHGSPNKNILTFKVGKDGGIYFTKNRDAAKLYTGLFGTGKVYNVDLNLGDKVVTIDNLGRAWTLIPEDLIAKSFGLTKEQVHSIIGSYNLGETPWHYGFTKAFWYKPKNNYYAIDQVVKLGKDQGISSLVINNVIDNGKRLFSRTMPYDLTVVYNPRQIIMGGQTPNLKLYGILKNFNNGLIRLGYTTSGIKQTKTPTGNFHWREDITDIDNPILLDIKPDMHYIRTYTTPVIKEVTNVDDMLSRIGIVPISNTPVLAVEQITVNPVNRLVKVGERVDLTLSPNRVVQLEYQPRLVDNKGRLVSSDADRYFGIPTKTEMLYTLWHKSGGSIHIKKENKGKFTESAKRAGKSVQEHARDVVKDPKATKLQKRRAQFALNSKKFKHLNGGRINYLNLF